MPLSNELRCLLIAAPLLAAVACDSGQTTVSGGNVEDASDCQGADCGDEDVGDEPRVTSLQIEPASADLLSDNGDKPSQDFSLVATFSDGSTGAYPGEVEFSIDTEKFGFIRPDSGEFIAHGIVGGQTEITAAALDDAGLPSATATVNVYIKRTHIADGLPDDVAEQFEGQQVDDPARAADIVYPLDGALMPQNVYPADIQWLNGAQDDLFQVRLSKPNAEVVAYLSHTGADFGNHWLVDQDAWRTMAQSDPDEAMGISVTRLEAATGEVIGSEAVRTRFANGTIAGSVYYWDIAAGRIVRINDGTATRDNFMPAPPAGVRGERCVGCHSVSNSGRYMVGRLGGGNNVGTVFDLTKDLTQDPAPTEFALDDPGRTWWFSTWNPDDTRIMVSRNEDTQANFALMDPFSGDFIEPQSGELPSGGGVTHPSWSPDGSLVAYVTNADAWGGANTTGDIAVLPVDGPDAFGQSEVIRAGTNIPDAHPAGAAASYPTWTPDSERIAFAHGTGSRSENMQSALYLMGRDGSGVVRLDAASGGEGGVDTFQPNFSPFETDDHYWLSYLSRRDYGNDQVGTRGASRQQIWVSAVKKSPDPDEDPSEVGYWLPGQDTESMNIAAYWAPQACRQDSETCSVGAECCSGECIPDEGGSLVCSPPPPERCRKVIETCSTDSDCCAGLSCVTNVCYPAEG